ncbi:MAG: hypothetical protein O2960_14260 [Verrucomicrobia bacterium]|nr:hypothetical protein [Verrucomicrobiota bacterium]
MPELWRLSPMPLWRMHFVNFRARNISVLIPIVTIKKRLDSLSDMILVNGKRFRAGYRFS